jgi:hypothetical protein
MTSKTKQDRPRFAVCISGEGYAASLVSRRLYEILPEQKASGKGLVRVIDESGEDYLFPVALFEEIDLPEPVRDKLKFR